MTKAQKRTRRTPVNTFTVGDGSDFLTRVPSAVTPVSAPSCRQCGQTMGDPTFKIHGPDSTFDGSLLWTCGTCGWQGHSWTAEQEQLIASGEYTPHHFWCGRRYR